MFAYNGEDGSFSNWWATDVELYGSNNNSDWTLVHDYGATSGNQSITFTCDNPDYYNYYKLCIYISGGKYHDGAGAKTITLTATEIVDATESDYDFYKDVDIYSSVKETVRKYYKYSTETFVQPIINSDGTLGGDRFACYCSTPNAYYPPYLQFDGNSATFGVLGYGTGYLIVYIAHIMGQQDGVLILFPIRLRRYR